MDSLDTRQQVAVVYLDFRKAFDFVSHNKLFTMLHSYGVCDCTVLLWVQNALTGHTHQTKVVMRLSDIDDLSLITGVVEGCGIGFLVYIHATCCQLFL